jgi:hypothetical protein
MGKLNKKPKNQEAKAKQLTLDSLPSVPIKHAAAENAHPSEKQIIIAEIGTNIREDELVLKIGFKLLPSKTVFSKVKAELWFDNQKISSVLISIPQGPLSTNDFELTPVLDMKGIPAGQYVIKVEMYEFWSSGERLSQAGKEVIVDYVPLTRESRLINIPIVKSVAGADLTVVSEVEKEIYSEIEKQAKREEISKRDNW